MTMHDNQAFAKHMTYLFILIIQLARPTLIKLEIKMKLAVNVNFLKEKTGLRDESLLRFPE